MGTRRPHTVTHKGPVPLHYYVRGIGSAAPALGEAVAWRGQRRAWRPRNGQRALPIAESRAPPLAKYVLRECDGRGCSAAGATTAAT